MPPRVNPRVPAEGAQAPDIAAILANLANSMADMATQVAATNVTVNNLANQVAAVNPNVNATPVFALSPGRADEDGILNYKTKQGNHVYEQARTELPSKFGMKALEVVLFETELESRAAASGWNSNVQGVTKFNNSDGNSIDLIKEYGKIDLETLKNACEPFITGNQKHIRRAQNNANASECILSSLDETARKRVLAYRKDYTINKQVVFPLIYTSIMRLATLDSTATDSALCNNIHSILEYAISKN